MHLTVLCNPDKSQMVLYKIARVVYAETGASSLRAVEALTSMIANASRVNSIDPGDIASDENMFAVLKKDSVRHGCLTVDANNRGFQMCLRVVKKMLNGNLPDTCFGATRFHRDDEIPDWARARGYIAEIDNLLFYL